nr:MAG TPA: hypothetical protein [Caudoviricetes sp.]
MVWWRTSIFRLAGGCRCWWSMGVGMTCRRLSSRRQMCRPLHLPHLSRSLPLPRPRPHRNLNPCRRHPCRSRSRFPPPLRLSLNPCRYPRYRPQRLSLCRLPRHRPSRRYRRSRMVVTPSLPLPSAPYRMVDTRSNLRAHAGPFPMWEMANTK